MEYLDSEIIISEVRKFPCLYDRSDINYKNREMRREAWTTVAKNVVGEIWNHVNKNTKSNLEKEVQKRWRSMKDSFYKTLRTGDAKKQKKPYLYHKQMAFLQAFYGPRETLDNIDADHSNNETEETDLLQNNYLEITTKEQPIVDQSDLSLPKKQKLDPFEAEIVNILKANVEQQSRVTQDPDEMFLLSQLPNIKKMKSTDKLQFQIKFLELIKLFINPD